MIFVMLKEEGSQIRLGQISDLRNMMKSDMIVEIVSALGGIPRHVGIEDSYEEVVEDFEVVGSSGRSD